MKETNEWWLAIGAISIYITAAIYYSITKEKGGWKPTLTRHWNIFVDPDRPLSQQRAFWLAISMPLVSAFILWLLILVFGQYTVAEKITNESINTFFSIFKLPFSIMALTIPLSLLVLRELSTAQTSKQLRQKDIDTANADKKEKREERLRNEKLGAQLCFELLLCIEQVRLFQQRLIHCLPQMQNVVDPFERLIITNDSSQTPPNLSSLRENSHMLVGLFGDNPKATSQYLSLLRVGSDLDRAWQTVHSNLIKHGASMTPQNIAHIKENQSNDTVTVAYLLADAITRNEMLLIHWQRFSSTLKSLCELIEGVPNSHLLKDSKYIEFVASFNSIPRPDMHLCKVPNQVLTNQLVYQMERFVLSVYQQVDSVKRKQSEGIEEEWIVH